MGEGAMGSTGAGLGSGVSYVFGKGGTKNENYEGSLNLRGTDI